MRRRRHAHTERKSSQRKVCILHSRIRIEREGGKKKGENRAGRRTPSRPPAHYSWFFFFGQILFPLPPLGVARKRTRLRASSTLSAGQISFIPLRTLALRRERGRNKVKMGGMLAVGGEGEDQRSALFMHNVDFYSLKKEWEGEKG